MGVRSKVTCVTYMIILTLSLPVGAQLVASPTVCLLALSCGGRCENHTFATDTGLSTGYQLLWLCDWECDGFSVWLPLFALYEFSTFFFSDDSRVRYLLWDQFMEITESARWTAHGHKHVVSDVGKTGYMLYWWAVTKDSYILTCHIPILEGKTLLR